ncbi:unnamed protein product [Adineta ricciae]|uniref:2'-phosphotransferase n=1 Tax=Adineta ricciae TaxID=249248 RepID=A0A813Q7V2_ADIRI|nr:unnamed protein product [Adineta ricciae]
MWAYILVCLVLCTNGVSPKLFRKLHGLETELNRLKCDMHDLLNTYKNEMGKSPFRNRSVDAITAAWQSTFPDGNYRTNTKNSIPFRQMNLRDPDTILRMAEYQAMVYCKSNILNSPSDISSIVKMSGKNLRVGNFTIAATGFDKYNVLYWYIAVNIPQQSILLVHRGTRSSNRNDVYDDLNRGRIHNSHGQLSGDFPYLLQSKDVYLDSGFYTRFQHEKIPIVTALRKILQQYSSPSFSFVVVGHSLGASWAFLNAAYFVGLNDINSRLSAIYTFGQPLLGSASFVNQITTKFDTPSQRYVRTVNGNDLVPHIGCEECVQPQYSNEKWVMNTTQVIWKDCNGGADPQCSSGVPCNQLSWANHSAVGRFSMRSEFCRVANNMQLVKQYERRQLKLGKRLAYILRYGAEKEGLQVDEGWISLSALAKVPLLSEYTENELLGEIQTSYSYRKTPRYQWERRPNGIYVRAAYGRKFERNPFHGQTQIRRLLDLALEYVCQNIDKYDFEGFPDEFLINEVIHRIKRNGKLTSRTLQGILSGTMEHLDLDGIYLTESGIRAVYTKCPNLRVLSLKGCGYILNDHYCEQLIRKCPLIESLDLSYCRHLTDRTLDNLTKYYSENLLHLILSGNQNYTGDAIVRLVSGCQHLRQLDIWDNPNCTNDVLNILIALGKSRSEDRAITIVHKHLQHPAVAPANPWAVVSAKTV